MRVQALLAAALCLSAMLAGCNSSTPPTPESDPCAADAHAAGCVYDEKTGSVRCVVTDEAYKPLAGVAIKVPVPGKKALEAVTGPDGTCGFDKLAPATYFIQATKKGYTSTTTSVDVVANTAPRVTKVLLLADPASVPTWEQFPFDGYIECSAALVYVGIPVCNGLPGLNDDFSYDVTPSRNLSWAQSELVWESTQQTGSNLNMDMTTHALAPGFFADNLSASPVVVRANETTLANAKVAPDTPIWVRVYAAGADGTAPGQNPLPPCSGVPGVVTACQVTGAGVALEQRVNIYTFLFYGFRPAPDYSFAKTNELPRVPA